MHTKDGSRLLDRSEVYTFLSKEDRYAMGWGDDKPGIHPVFPSHLVDELTGQPFDLIRFINLAEKYLQEAKLADANYLPDQRAIRIRVLKAASLLVSALQVHGEESDYSDIAGVSSTAFPVLHGGLAVKNGLTVLDRTRYE